MAPFIVFARKAVTSLFLRWYSRPLLQQQNSFNRAVSLRIQELLDAQRELRREVEAQRSELGAADDER